GSAPAPAPQTPAGLDVPPAGPDVSPAEVEVPSAGVGLPGPGRAAQVPDAPDAARQAELPSPPGRRQGAASGQGGTG
ncbi:hypothetical protein ACFXB3_41190, partial [Streptomyces sp. NPDC059447]